MMSESPESEGTSWTEGMAAYETVIKAARMVKMLNERMMDAVKKVDSGWSLARKEKLKSWLRATGL
jgi:hypothetical protein